MIEPEPSIEPGVGHRLERVGQVEALLGGEDRGGGAAGVEGLDLAPLERAAGEVVDQLPGRDPELDLVVAGPPDAAGDRDHLGPRRLLGPEPLEPLGPVGDDPRHVGEGLDVVDQRRPAVEALDRRERRLQPRVAALAFERVEQRRLLAADVGAGAAVDDQLEVAVAAEDVARRGSRPRRPRRPPASRMSPCRSYSPRMKMNACEASAARAAIAIPSISWCGLRCISSRSLKAPGSDSSALQQRYLAISPRGRKEAFLPIEKPAPPRPRRPESSSSFRTSSASSSR